MGCLCKYFVSCVGNNFVNKLFFCYKCIIYCIMYRGCDLIFIMLRGEVWKWLNFRKKLYFIVYWIEIEKCEIIMDLWNFFCIL